MHSSAAACSAGLSEHSCAARSASTVCGSWPSRRLSRLEGMVGGDGRVVGRLRHGRADVWVGSRSAARADDTARGLKFGGEGACGRNGCNGCRAVAQAQVWRRGGKQPHGRITG
eukprot:scaffold63694_cov68-Phaeocystis_antarctica.AAC.3